MPVTADFDPQVLQRDESFDPIHHWSRADLSCYRDAAGDAPMDRHAAPAAEGAEEAEGAVGAGGAYGGEAGGAYGGGADYELT